MCDVRRDHEEATVADAGRHAPGRGARVQGGELPNDIVVAEREDARLAPVLQVLRRGADDRELKDPIARAERRPTFHHGVRADPGAAADAHVGPDDGVGVDLDAIVQLGAPRDRCRRVDACSGRRRGEHHLGDDRLARGRHPAEAPRRPSVHRHHLEAERVAGQDRPAEASLLHGHDAELLPLPVRHERAGQLRQGLAQHDAGQDGRPGEVAGEIGLVGAHDLHADGAHARLHLEHAIDELVGKARGDRG